MIVCVVPRQLERKLAARLRGALAPAGVEVVVDRRDGEDRRARSRRHSPGRPRRMLERRGVRAADGRRVAERRLPAVPVERPSLPWRLRTAAERVAFVAPLEAPAELTEDVAAARAVIRWQLHDRSALQELYLTWFDRAYAFAQVSLGNAGAAADAVQDAFAGVFEQIDDLDPATTAFRACLFGELVAAVRSRRVGEPPERRDGGPGGGDEPADDPTVLRWVNDKELVLLVRQLPDDEREGLLLRFAGGLRDHEIAALLDLGPDSERALAAAGLGRLRRRLADLGAGVESSQREAMRRLAQPSTVLRGRRLALFPG
jgi:DNA-directed RNA polymerase specialized sigma24 family protein